MPAGPYDALLVISFGGPEGPDDVVPFLENVTRGRGIPEERLAQVGEHYLSFGGVSPINGQARALIAALTDELAGTDLDLPIYWGNRNWHPLLADTVAGMRDDGVHRALAFVTSAYSSYSSCRQYLDDISEARAAVGDRAPKIDKIRTFHDHPGFIEPMADQLTAALAQLGPDAAIAFTAHSIPQTMAGTSAYEAELTETARLVADRAAPGRPWSLVWQSRSGPPQVPWLEPDIGDHLRSLAAAGVRQVAVAPIGFISDHMEVVYDLDTEAAALASTLDLEMVRVATVGTDPRFVSMIRCLIEERTVPTTPRANLGTLGLRPDVCPKSCCPAAPPRGIHDPRARPS